MYKLNVRIVEAKGLPKMDVIGSVDPYCQLYIGDRTQMKQTRTIRQNKNPIWNQEFQFSIKDFYNESLTVILKDFDKVSADDPISKLQIPLKTLQMSTVKDNWYDMIPFKRVKKGGKLRLVLHLGPNNEKPFDPQTKVNLDASLSIQQNHLNNAYPSIPNQASTMGNIPQVPQPYMHAMPMPMQAGMPNQYQSMYYGQQPLMMAPNQQAAYMPPQQFYPPNQQQQMMYIQQPYQNNGMMMANTQQNLPMQQTQNGMYSSEPALKQDGKQQMTAQQTASTPLNMQYNYQSNPMMMQQNYPNNTMYMMPQMQPQATPIPGQQQQTMMMQQQNVQNNYMMPQQMQQFNQKNEVGK